MRHLDLSRPACAPSPRLARLVRHLDARLHDLALGWPEVISADQDSGILQVRFPDLEINALARELAGQNGIVTTVVGEQLHFCLTEQLSFEDLDYIWGALFTQIPEAYQ